MKRREFLTGAAATVAGAGLASKAGAFSMASVLGDAPNDFGMQAFVDLAGTIPAKPGDAVALVRWGFGPPLISPVASKCPVYGIDPEKGPYLEFDGIDDEIFWEHEKAPGD